MKRIVSILFTLYFLGCICFHAQKVGEYPISENRDMALEISVVSSGNMDESGLEINHVRFSRDEKYGNHISGKEEEFYFDDVICTQEEWLAKTRLSG